MHLDAATAKALFLIIMLSTQGAGALTPQLPLRVEDRGESWLVMGTPYTSPYANFCMSDMFFRKDTGEVIGIMSHGRIPTTTDKKAYWLTIMSQEEYGRVFGAPTRFEPNGIPDIVLALSGGLVNTPRDTADYAAALLHLKTSTADIKAADLQATEVAGVWHIRRKAGAQEELLRFTRSTGKVLSDNL